jgi:hypothetical protein
MSQYQNGFGRSNPSIYQITFVRSKPSIGKRRVQGSNLFISMRNMSVARLHVAA